MNSFPIVDWCGRALAVATVISLVPAVVLGQHGSGYRPPDIVMASPGFRVAMQELREGIARLQQEL